MRWPLLLPLFALVIATAGIFGALAIRSGSDDSSPATLAREAAVQDRVDLVPAATPTPREPGDVCQGFLSRRAGGGERVFHPRYTQVTEARGISIVASEDVDPDAVEVARKTIDDVFEENELGDILAEEGAYVIVTDGREGILDLPEFECLSEGASASIIEHACGIADRADNPVAAVNEWDLTDDPRGPCGGHNILYHELGHLVQGWALAPQDYYDVKYAYQDALNEGLYEGDYARTNPNEYFAEATQAYFLSVDRRGRQDRDWLEAYDPTIYELVDRVYSGR